MTSRTRRPVSPAPPGERGFTLAETAIALLIMMIASIGVVSLFSYSVKYNAGAKDRELAMAVAQKRMEWLRGIPYSSATRALAYRYPTAASPTSGGLGKTVASGVTETTTSGGRSYKVVTTITNFNNATDAASVMKTVTIRVTPDAANDVFGQVTLTTQRSILSVGTN